MKKAQRAEVGLQYEDSTRRFEDPYESLAIVKKFGRKLLASDFSLIPKSFSFKPVEMRVFDNKERETISDPYFPRHNAYLQSEGRMYINTDDIKQESDQLEELPKKEGVVMLMRVFHESAHHIQKETGLRYASIRQVEGKWIDSTKEDFVDFLTGVFAYSMEKQREISVEDVAAARESLRIIGADVCEPGTRESARPAAGEKSATGHSVGAARVELFDKGYAMAKEKGIGKAFKRAQVEYVDLPGRRPRSTTVRREL